MRAERFVKSLLLRFFGLRATSQVAIGYALYMLVGWVLLSLPVSHEPGSVATSLDHLFSAVSAVSTTGLSTVPTAGAYSVVGEVVILCLIQVGGLGYMTLGSFVMLSRTGELSERRRQVGETAFVLPSGFEMKSFLRAVVVFALIAESAGAAALYPSFRAAGVESPLWQAVFHSVSAFCTAGFSLFDTSLEAFRDDPAVNATIAVLACLGAIGFIVMLDGWRRVTGASRRLTLTSRLILLVTAWFVVGATLLISLGDSQVSQLPAHQRLLTSCFQAMSAMTTVGFNTTPISGMAQSSTVVLMVLMLIGASPSGTGGGLKTTTFTAMWGFARSQLQGEESVRFWGRTIPYPRLRTAAAATALYAATLVVAMYLLELLADQFLFEDLLFEAVSALGTVGLSRGITSELPPLACFVIIGLMFAGRVGPLTLAVALSLRTPRPRGDDLAV